jgi:hypothetical protein
MYARQHPRTVAVRREREEVARPHQHCIPYIALDRDHRTQGNDHRAFDRQVAGRLRESQRRLATRVADRAVRAFVPRGILREGMMERLDAVLGGFRSNPECRLAYDESMLERCAPSLALCVDSSRAACEPFARPVRPLLELCRLAQKEGIQEGTPVERHRAYVIRSLERGLELRHIRLNHFGIQT